MTTKITPSVLENTTVTPSTYGTASQVSTVTVDAQGRVTGASNTSIAIDTSQITSGTLADARLPNSGATAGSYGSASIVPRIIVDAKGRATGVANIAIQIATSQITGYPTFASSATTDTTNAGNISSGTLPDARLSNAGVNSGSFGSASVVPAITVDTKGRVTAVTATSIAIGSGAVSGLATSATTDTTNADNITTGTLATARLSSVAVNIGQFGSASQTPRITVNAKGQVTDLSLLNIAIAAGAVSGLAGVATSGSYNDLSNKPSIPAAQVNSDWNAASGVTQILNKPSLATVATTGSYTDLSNKPTIPTNTNELTNGAGFLTSLAPAVAGIGSIMYLYQKTTSAYALGNVIAGSNLWYTSFVGNSGVGSTTARVVSNNYNSWKAETRNGPFGYVEPSTIMPGATTVSGTWKALTSVAAPSLRIDDPDGAVWDVNGSFWQRVS